MSEDETYLPRYSDQKSYHFVERHNHQQINISIVYESGQNETCFIRHKKRLCAPLLSISHSVPLSQLGCRGLLCLANLESPRITKPIQDGGDADADALTG